MPPTVPKENKALTAGLSKRDLVVNNPFLGLMMSPQGMGWANQLKQALFPGRGGGGIGLYPRTILDVPLKIHPKSWVGYTSFFHQKEMIYQRSSKSKSDVVIHVIQVRGFRPPNTFMA